MPKALQVIFSFVDDKGKTATTSVNIETTHTLAGALEFAQEVAVLINNVTTCKITAVNVSAPVDISGLGLATSPGATSDIEEKGVFQYETAGGWKTSVSVPGWSDLLVLSGTDTIDIADSDVAAFNDMMIDGITPTTYATLVEPSDTREDDIDSLDWARERFRASGKRA